MILAVLEASAHASPFPGALTELLIGKPMLTRQIERIGRARLIDRVVIATSGHPDDDGLASLARDLKIDCYRGAVDDVLDRHYQCAKRYAADHVVRLSSRSPLIDPVIIDAVVREHLSGRHDYTSNGQGTGFPEGQIVEIMDRPTLVAAWERAMTPGERASVTGFILHTNGAFRIGQFQSTTDFSHARCALDGAEDLPIIRMIFESLYPHRAAFTIEDVAAFLDEHPEILSLNGHYAPYEASNVEPIGGKSSVLL